MAIDGFLKVPDIPGPSARSGHEGEIEVHGVVFAMEAPRNPGGLARVGRVRFDPVVITKRYDVSSPLLAQALAEGRRFDEVVIAIRDGADDAAGDAVVVTLTDAVLTRFALRPGADEAGVLDENLAFTYGSIAFASDGGPTITLSASVDR